MRIPGRVKNHRKRSLSCSFNIGLVLQVIELTEPGGTGGTSKSTHSQPKGPKITLGQEIFSIGSTKCMTDIWGDSHLLLCGYTSVIDNERLQIEHARWRLNAVSSSQLCIMKCAIVFRGRELFSWLSNVKLTWSTPVSTKEQNLQNLNAKTVCVRTITE